MSGIFFRRLGPSQVVRLEQHTKTLPVSCIHTPLQARTITTERANRAINLPPHSMLPAGMFWRSLLVSSISSNPLLLSPLMAILSFFEEPQTGLMNLKDNPVLKGIFKSTLYNHFCAGENSEEVKATIRHVKDMGCKGVILTCAAETSSSSSGQEEVGVGAIEIQNADVKFLQQLMTKDPPIEAWRQGVMESVSMVGEGDYIALKLSTAGATVTDALSTGKLLPDQMALALDQVCEAATRRKVSILVDAETQSIQTGIDDLAMDLMRRYNRGPNPVVYNTYQAYLKDTPRLLRQHLRQAQQENFAIGVKLVRGAYMDAEPRHLIHDTKEDTDAVYDSLAKCILQRQYPGQEKDGSEFPWISLFMATHNSASVFKAFELQRDLAHAGKPMVKVHYGQLLGMADEVSCTLLQLRSLADQDAHAVPPEVYKCLSWGPVDQSASYLLRRALESRDAAGRTEEEYSALKREALRRISVGLGFIKQTNYNERALNKS